MTYPTGCKLWIDGKDVTYFFFGTNTFDPSAEINTFRNIDITSYLRRVITPDQMVDRNFNGLTSPNLHTIEITAEDGNGRVECRVEIV